MLALCCLYYSSYCTVLQWKLHTWSHLIYHFILQPFLSLSVSAITHMRFTPVLGSESITCPTNGMPVVSVPPRRQAKDAAAHRSGLSSSSEKSAVYWPLVCFLSVPCWQQAKLALVLRPLSPKIRLSSTGSKGQEKVTVMLFFSQIASASWTPAQ